MINKIINLTKRLYPTGRAFKLPAGSNFLKLHTGLAQSESRAYNDALSILHQILPDNAYYTAEDATVWEKKLQLPVVEDTDLEVRKESILRRLRHPGNILARQHYLYVQKQLRDAGFPITIHVHENLFRTDLSFFNEFNTTANNYKIATNDLFLYVTNRTNDNILVYDVNTFALLHTIGTSGSGDGQFDNPSGIYVHGDFLYILDNGNNRVQVFDVESRTFVGKFGSSGDGFSEINNPLGICATDDLIYVSDSVNNRIQVFRTETFEYVDQIGTSGVGECEFDNPQGIDIQEGFLYIADTGNDRVQVLNASTLSFVYQVGTTGSGNGQFNEPVDIRVHNEYFYVLDRTNEIISTFSVANHEFIGSSNGVGLTMPNGITTAGNYLYVVDTSSSRIQVLNLQDGSEVASVTVSDDPTHRIFTSHSNTTTHGVSTHHGFVGNIIASGIVANQLNEEDEDIDAQTSSTLRSTFFIGGDNFPDFVAIPAERERELRNLILTLKPLHTYAYLMVNYI